MTIDIIDEASCLNMARCYMFNDGNRVIYLSRNRFRVAEKKRVRHVLIEFFALQKNLMTGDDLASSTLLS